MADWTCSLCGHTRKRISGAFLRKRRQEELAESLRSLAAKDGLTAGYLCDIENGRRYPTDRILKLYFPKGGYYL